MICSLLLWLAVLALLLAVWTLAGTRLLVSERAAALGKRLCGRLCPIAIALAALAGVVLGLWACDCGPTVVRLLREDACRALLVVLLLLLVLAMALLAIALASCPRAEIPSLVREEADSKKTRNLAARAPALALPLLMLLLLVLIVRCCGVPSLTGALFGDTCARRLGLLVLLILAALFLYLLQRRYCRERIPAICRRVPVLLVLVTSLALLAVVTIWRCCRHIGEKDYDLAMVGIWWEGAFPGEAGAHLRWAFRYGLTFPNGGFDLFRRPSGAGPWTPLNGAPIRPADVFNDGAPAPGPMWQHRGVDRLHTSRWSHFQGTPFAELADQVARPPFDLLFYVQAPDDAALPAPASPYTTQAAADAYLATYAAAGTAAHPANPLVQWQMMPMTSLAVASLDPEIARLLGLLYIDTTADPNVEYDYRVVGHWPDGDRSYTVERLSRPRTAPLNPTVLTAATTPIPYVVPSGTVHDDAAVGLRWTPPTTTPEIGLSAADGIQAIRQRIRRIDLGTRPCPAAVAAGGTLEMLRRRTGAEVAPIALVPRDDSGTLTWPDYFFTDRNVESRCYGYAIEGLDIFGRASPLSNSLIADVQDRTGPPPPPNVEATVFQRADATTLAGLSSSERAALFPTGSTHSAVLRVSWVWPNAFLTTVPDTKEFRVYLKIAGYQAFAQPASRALWPLPANWDLAAVTIPLSASQSLPARLTDAGVTDARYYQTTIQNPPMAPDDDHPVIYGFLGVGAVDHDPFNNPGPVSPPTVIFSRDFVPPVPPPIPTVNGSPKPVDKGSNALLTLSWPADGRYVYHLLRAPGRALAALPTPTGTPPACLSAEMPSCSGTDPTCTESHRRFRQRWKAALHPELFGTVSQAPRKPDPVALAFQFLEANKVDATVGDDHLFSGRAIDAAGNQSAQGCPAIVVVRDFFPPRQPTITRVLGGEGIVRISWIANAESDLAQYRLYRTADPNNDASLDRMTLVLEASPLGVATGPTGVSSATRTGVGTAYVTLTWEDRSVRALKDYLYRLVAVDSSGNVSEMSAPGKGRAMDTTPPSPSVWSTPAVARDTDAQGAFVTLLFAPPAGDPNVRFRIQRRDTGAAFWAPISEWLDAGTTQFQDRRVRTTQGYTYRIQAMDPAGNVSNFSEPRSAP